MRLFARLAAGSSLFAPVLALACQGSLTMEVDAAGVYAVSQGDVVAKAPGLANCPHDALVITVRGKEVPLRITGRGDTFQPGDRIEWVGQPLHGPESWFDSYSTVNAYVLAARPGPHARIREASGGGTGGNASFIRRTHLEQDNLMIRLNQSLVELWSEPDYWHWAKITHVDPKPHEVTFDLPDLAPRGGSITARLMFRGLSNVSVPMGPKGTAVTKPADHTVHARLNGQDLGQLSWDGRKEFQGELKLPLAALKAAGNTLELSVPKRHAGGNTTPLVDVVMFNWVEMDYPVAGDLAASREPIVATTGGTAMLRHGGARLALYAEDGTRLSGNGSIAGISPGMAYHPVIDDAFATPVQLRARTAEDWRTPATPYDYLMIAHPRLIEAARPLAEFHRQRGLKVALIDVNDIYDQYNDGIAHPVAIRNLLSQAYHHWPTPRPRFALLVGDASFDIRHKQINRRNLAKFADNELLEPGQFGDIPSTPYEQTPDDLPHRNLIPTWQFPSYDGQSASDNHFASVGDSPLHPVIAIGRFPVVEPAEVKAIVDKTIAYMKSPALGKWRRDVMFITDESSYFKTSSDEIAGALDKQGFLSEKVYASAEEKDNIAHQADIKDGLNEGRLLVHFLGHGGRYIWRTGPPDLRKNHDLFTLEDVSGLKNGTRLPMILSMTCYSAPFDNPTEDSIGERFLREPGKGAVAVFAASWRNSPSPAFSKAIMTELTTPGRTIGESIVIGKATNTDPTLVETYNLLGDPAVILERPTGELTLRRRAGPYGRPYIDAEVAGAGFRGQVATDWLDSKGQVVHSARFTAIGKRFSLPTPPDSVTATEVRTYVADASRGFDAISRLELTPLPKPTAAPDVHKRRGKRNEPALENGERLYQSAFEPIAPADVAPAAGGAGASAGK
ncbi:C25 family cysteine peptidase [Tahibacter amnicola]|uniref:C25 family cysteine peptidase n=1 Tax=Tahibacter amnicola TaxID=2976241 RepID=A0ABY6BD17_9GAMM|nr:C25 family cysteine peptidase [Tahibacter amnicola]UXI67943.1 C25 family cysteine peptidase [Tahibacter amnicola]